MTPRSLIVVLMLALASVALSIPPSADADPGSARLGASADLPTGPTVKQILNGKGPWRVSRSSIEALGSEPSRCRSDEQMLAYSGARARWYSGAQRGLNTSIWVGAQVAVLRYADVASARDALARNASYPRRCPKVREWVCTDCDGVWTTWRTKVRTPPVGAESTGWSFREVGNFKSNGYTVVARRGSTVVRVTVTRTRDVTTKNGWRYPPLGKQRAAVRLAHTALREATT